MSKFGVMTRSRIGCGVAGAVGVLVAVAVAAHISVSVAAAQRPVTPAPSSDTTTRDQGAAMMGQNMMMMRQKMMADQKAADAQLQSLLDKMNAAKGGAKIDAMAAVLAELARQRMTDRDSMNHMSQMMMPNMMGMMMQGMTTDMRTMAAQCPMMKGFGEAPPKQ